MTEAARAAGFIVILLSLIAWGNWYVDSYGVFRVTYDKIAACLAAKRNIAGLTESKANERDLAAAYIQNPDTKPEYGVFGSSRVFMFEGQMMESVFHKMKENFHIRTECFSYRLFQRLRMFFLVCTGFVFFRAPSM